MKIVISYPPIDTNKGYPTLGQNRQFQFFKEPTYIYPVIPATAATLLKQAGHEAIWNDCIAENWSYARFLEFIKKENPDLVAFETKTPVVKQHWKIIDELKAQSPRLKVVLFGDHVTALPEESFRNSKVDFVITGGDYDFLLLNLCNFLQTKRLSPQISNKLETKETVSADIELEPGIYYRDNGQIRNIGKFHHLLLTAPLQNGRIMLIKTGTINGLPAHIL